MTAGFTKKTAPIIMEAEGRRSQVEAVAQELPKILKNITDGRRGLILMDWAFEGREAPYAQLGLPTVRTRRRGEAAKTPAEALRLLKIMSDLGLARDDWLIVRGGGALCDLGAFCAGLYRRGLRLVLVPTTLLAAVDAAVGGKTAVNFAGAKNQLGLFYLPDRVLIDLEALARLPRELLADGLVEAYKAGLLFDQKLRRLVIEQTDELLAGRPDFLAEVVRRSCAAKAVLAARDFREEKGRRDILNLGHTYGHVLESWHAPSLSHGRAVAFGLAVTARFSLSRGLIEQPLAEEIWTAGKVLGGPWPALPPRDEAIRLLNKDKKIRSGALKFVVLEGPGRPALLTVPAEEILEAAEEIKHV